MATQQHILSIILCLVSLVVVTFVAAVEAALFAVSETRVQAALERGVSAAQRLNYWLRHPGRVLSTLMLMRIWAVVIGAGVAADWGEDWPVLHGKWLALIAMGSLVLLVNLAGRTLAKRYAFEWACATIGLVRVLTVVLLPFVWPFTLVPRLLLRWSGSTSGWVAPFWTPREMERLGAAYRADVLSAHDEDLLLKIISFSDTVIREIMVPRTDMVTIADTASFAEVRQVVTQAGHSRIPVYDDTIDNIVGILYVKDLFAVELNGHAAGFELRKLVRPAFYVPEIMKISELLRDFQRRQTHLAVVVDEYGGTAGLVTLEDIIEEIVGEIQDEYDVEEKQFRVISETKLIADGRVSIWDLENVLDLRFPRDAGYETLAGFIMAQSGYMPEPGASITWNGFRFTVKEANEKRISTVEIDGRHLTEGPPATSQSPARPAAT